MAISEIIGSNVKFRALLDNVEMVAPVNSAVLIQGDTGAGKEVIVRAIHEASPRRRNRFVALNCAGIPTKPTRKRTLRIRYGRLKDQTSSKGSKWVGVVLEQVVLNTFGENIPIVEQYRWEMRREDDI